MTFTRKIAFNVLAVCLCLFVLIAANTNLFNQQPNLVLFGLLGAVLVLLSKPACKWCPKNQVLQWMDCLLIAAVVVTFGYVFAQSEPKLSFFWVNDTILGDRAGNENTTDHVLSLIGLLLVLEVTRRAIGWTLPILCVLFIAYALYGPSMPDWLFPHRGFTWQQVVQKSFLQAGGVFGIALKVMFYYVFLFVLFGTLLEQTGATAYIIDFARRIFQRVPGGPALVSVVSSAMMGSLSGSAVANTATTGTMTIPLMKSSGFNSETAAGVEAAASSGGALMPPIMGAGAFMMLEMVEPAVTYPEIIKAAIIPAALYYISLLLMVYLYAQRIGAAAVPEHEQDSVAVEGRWRGVVFFGGFLVLISMLVPPLSLTPFRSVSISLVAILVLSAFHRSTWLGVFQASEDTRADEGEDQGGEGSETKVKEAKEIQADLAPSPPTNFFFCYLVGVYNAMVNAARSGVSLVVAASSVGIILAVVDMTGIGATLPAKVLELSYDNSILALVLLMISTIILGMGLPSAVCYLLMAILVGTVLTKLETAPLAAHLFIFYFGMMSMVTPPVALAAYAGAAIAKADVMRSAFSAFRFALVGFALPFAFVLSPELIMLTPENEVAGIGVIAASVVLTLVAIIGLSAGITGYAFSRLDWRSRTALIPVSLLIFFCRLQSMELWLQIGAAAIVLAIVGFSLRATSASNQPAAT